MKRSKNNSKSATRSQVQEVRTESDLEHLPKSEVQKHSFEIRSATEAIDAKRMSLKGRLCRANADLGAELPELRRIFAELIAEGQRGLEACKALMPATADV